jgi:uncharacterized damage-inducible protein DinB
MQSMNHKIVSEFIEQSNMRIQESLDKITACLAGLSGDEIWQRPNENSNSVGNLVLHLCGNIRQYIISSLGNTPDKRDRDAEFAAAGGVDKSRLLEQLTATISQAKDIIANASPDELLRVRQVQGFKHSGVAIIIHVTEHLSYHTGQIIFWTKLLKNKDLGFYRHIDLNVRNAE